MAFLKSRRSQFIAWTIIYALAVALMASKGGEEGLGFLWGLSLGAGAGIATCTLGPEDRIKRLGVVGMWVLACWTLGLALFWDDPGHNASVWKRMETIAFGTLTAGFPALLALLVWIFRRPKIT